MNRDLPASQQAIRLRALDRVCDDFEAAWRAGQEPSVRAYLKRAAPEIQEDVFCELVKLDLAYRRSRGECLEVSDYLGAAAGGQSASEESRAGAAVADSIWGLVAEDNGSVGAHPPGAEGNAAAPGWAASHSPEIGDYELLEKMGCGGTGTVYRARQRSLDRTVAVKIVDIGGVAIDDGENGFPLQPRAASRLQHPGIVTLFGAGHVNLQHYLAMEFVEGRSLWEIAGGEPVAPDRAAEFLVQAADAVGYAHQEAVLHRDLNPGNLLVDRCGRVRITDFGLPKRMVTGSDNPGSACIVGTPGFLPPEQVRGDRAILDGRSDVYSLGAILYLLLAGRPPHQSKSLFATICETLQSEPPSPEKMRTNADRGLAAIAMRCLCKEPADRYPTAASLAVDLRRWLARR